MLKPYTFVVEFRNNDWLRPCVTTLVCYETEKHAKQMIDYYKSIKCQISSVMVVQLEENRV